ncbi:MAG TPA: alkaline phosphatase family protein [Bryobacteraceae bacterium]|nr:alkaline phosphatase family protein [Bryobacteraceae bacterium]
MLSDPKGAAPERQLLIGLDAMEWSLVQSWAQAGALPTFRNLLENCAHATLASTAAQLPDTVWSAIYSGMNPAHFAKYFYVQYDARTGDLKMKDDDSIGATPFWRYLVDAGRKVCVLDVPKFPVSRMEGVYLANWGTHATKTARASHPAGLLDEINRRFGPHPVGECDAVDANPKALGKLRERILEGVRVRGELCRWLLARERWDVFFAAFSESHCAGHHFWQFLDPSHPNYDAADRNGLRDTMQQVYQAIDREIGRMLDSAGDMRCLVFSGHGMGPIWHASWNLQEILDRLGLGRIGAPNLTQDAREAGANPWRILKKVMPGRLQYAIKAILPLGIQNELIFRWYAGPRHWTGCRAIAVPNNDSVGAIRILVDGRDRHGLVAREDYENMCDAIAAALEELRDPATGRNVVLLVSKIHRDFDGPYAEGLPDLTVLWDQSFAWKEIASPALGRLRIRMQDNRSGSHTPRGFVLARGYGAAPGEDAGQATLYDVAPTVLHAAGVAQPNAMHGHPLFVPHMTASAAAE